jgi:hypothetical protein
MSEKIWMVGGSTGEYSDRVEWAVDAWRSEAEAQARVKFLDDKMRELGLCDSRDDYDIRDQKELAMRAFDPAFSCDYTGSHYYICELELKP